VERDRAPVLRAGDGLQRSRPALRGDGGEPLVKLSAEPEGTGVVPDRDEVDVPVAGERAGVAGLHVQEVVRPFGHVRVGRLFAYGGARGFKVVAGAHPAQGKDCLIARSADQSREDRSGQRDISTDWLGGRWGQWWTAARRAE